MNPTAEHAEHTDPATTKPEEGGKRVGKRVLEYIFAVGLLLGGWEQPDIARAYEGDGRFEEGP